MTLIPSGTFLQKGLLSILLLFLFTGVSINSNAGIFDEGDPEAGALIWDGYCVTCHEIDRAKSAPPLKGIDKNWGSTEEMLVMWIQSPSAARATGDEYINKMYNQYSSQYADMTAQLVSVEDIKNVMAYIKNPPVAEGAEEDSGCVTIHDMEIEDEGTSDKWFLVVGILFLIIILSAAGVTRSLKNAIRERDGQAAMPHETYWQSAKKWMWSNLVFTSLVGIFATIFVLVWLYIEAMGIAVVENYSPEQPVWFSHSVHVCENDIECEYCHHSARKSKHAGIPTSDVCMNCHKYVQDGPKTGKDEINKIYAAIGFDPVTTKYIGAEQDTVHFSPQDDYPGEPIVWNKVHNLPDHVYFSHAQHVEIGGLDCKNCHGPVQTFTVGRVSNTELTNSQTDVPGLVKLSKQTLTMGWCIECHNKAEIDKSNEYYVEMHDRMSATARGQEEMRKIMEDGSQTVKEFGGWECAKCHY